MIGLAVALVRDLAGDPMIVRRRYAQAAVHEAVVSGVSRHGDDFVLQVGSRHPVEEADAGADGRAVSRFTRFLARVRAQPVPTGRR